MTRKKRLKIYMWTALALVVGFGVWAWIYLKPNRWYKYTDQVAFEQVALGLALVPAVEKALDRVVKLTGRAVALARVLLERPHDDAIHVRARRAIRGRLARRQDRLGDDRHERLHHRGARRRLLHDRRLVAVHDELVAGVMARGLRRMGQAA